MNLFDTPLEGFKKKSAKALGLFSQAAEQLESTNTSIDVETEREKTSQKTLEEKLQESKDKQKDYTSAKAENEMVVSNIKKMLGSVLKVEAPKKKSEDK